MTETTEEKAREILNEYLKTNTAYKLSKETGVKQPTITRFARNESTMNFRTWDRLLPEINKAIND
jgi:DNA-binding MurR/RpiR family transcriptional regulator